MLWNEDNTPMDIPWIRDAYKHEKYAFVADYVRFLALYNYGGIYLDTDMLLIKPLDIFLHDGLFLGREDKYNASMGIIGAEAHCEFCKLCLDFYNQTKFNMSKPPIITRFITPILIQSGLKEEDITQKLDNGATVYQSSFFYPIHYSQAFNLQDITPPKYGGYVSDDKPTFGIHLWNKSWTDEIELLAKGNYVEGFHLVWKRIKRNPILHLRYYRKVLKYILVYFFGRHNPA